MLFHDAMSPHCLKITVSTVDCSAGKCVDLVIISSMGVETQL